MAHPSSSPSSPSFPLWSCAAFVGAAVLFAILGGVNVASRRASSPAEKFAPAFVEADEAAFPPATKRAAGKTMTIPAAPSTAPAPTTYLELFPDQTVDTKNLVPVREAALLMGGNRSNTLVVHLHFHACSGKQLCKFLRDAIKEKRSGVKLDDNQIMTAACNQLDPDPPARWIKENVTSCQELRRYTSQRGGSNFMLIETPLDFRPPCPGVGMMTVIREPWGRLEATQGKRGWTFPNASNVIKNMSKGDDPLASHINWYYCDAPHAPTCQPFFKAGYFNNYYIRTILGWYEGAHIPWDMVTEEHFEKAKGILEQFDLVIPIEHLADALPGLQCTGGPRYDFGLDGTPGGRYSWTSTRKGINLRGIACDFGTPHTVNDRDRLELCQLFNKFNQWDRKLWEWSLYRWRGWNSGRCHTSLSIR